ATKPEAPRKVSGDYADDEDTEEDAEDYCKGGYHPVALGDVYNARYDVLRKLGWGHFSTVWLCRDRRLKRPTALKIVKSAAHYTETALDEISLLEKAGAVATASQSFHKQFVVELYDSFRISGPHGTHVAMSFEVLGPNLLSMIKRYDHRGIPMAVVKRIAKQVLMGLEYLHVDCGIIHTDLKPENILIQIDVDKTMKEFGLDKVLVSDLPVPLLQPDAKVPSPSKFDIPTDTPLTAGQKKKLKNQAKKLAAALEATAESPQPADLPVEMVSPAFSLSAYDSTDPPPLEIDIQRQSSTSDMDVESVTSDVLENDHAPLSPVKFRAEQPPSPPVVAGEDEARPIQDTGSLLASAESSTQSLPAADELSDIVGQTNSVRLSSPEKKRAEAAPAKHPDYNVRVKIADLGNSCWTHKHFTMDIQTRQYRSPEVILGQKYDTSTDLWSFGCIIFELLTGDFLFDPKSGSKYNKDDDHVAQIIELMGAFPKPMTQTGKYASDIFNRKGKLRLITLGDVRHIHKLRFWKLQDVLHEKYKFSKPQADDIAEFIIPSIQIVPSKRATAAELIDAPWIRDIDIDPSFSNDVDMA
ncbi:serine/threonine protein kinase, CMGC group, partial [Kappamyces sp. JEL0680]